MRMIPVGSCLVWNMKIVEERISRLDGALGYESRSVCPICSTVLENAMPVLNRLLFAKNTPEGIQLTIDVLVCIELSVNWSTTLILRLSPYRNEFRQCFSHPKFVPTLLAFMTGPGNTPSASTALERS